MPATRSTMYMVAVSACGAALITAAAWADAFDDGLAAYVRADYATAIKYWEPLAEAGNADAQHNVGVLYETGQGVGRNYLTAAALYRRAAAQGHPDAQLNLAKLYESGNGVPQDLVRAYVWFSVSANISLNGMLWSGMAAMTSRDAVTTRMTPEQLAAARDLARRCQDSNFIACE